MFRRTFFGAVAAATAYILGPDEDKFKPPELPPTENKQRSTDVQILRIDMKIHDCFEMTPIDWFEMKPGDEVYCSWNNRPLDVEHWWISGKPFWDKRPDGTEVEAVAVSRSFKVLPTLLRGMDLKNFPKPMPSK